MIQYTPLLWTVSNKNAVFSSYLDDGFPVNLNNDQLKQILKVFSTCIHPSQFIPQLFNNNNSQQIHDSGLHIAKQIQSITSYYQINSTSISQHCRHLLTVDSGN
jgi:hypothetical protein